MSVDENASQDETPELPIHYWLVPAGEDGRPVPTRAIPIREATQLNEYLAPVMPMYDLDLAAQMLCMKKQGLIAHLYRHKAEHPARYRRIPLKHGPTHIRLLSADEIRMIQKRILVTKRPHGVSKAERERASLTSSDAMPPIEGSED